MKLIITAAAFAAAALVVHAADFALAHVDESDAIAQATHGFRTIHRLPEFQA